MLTTRLHRQLRGKGYQTILTCLLLLPFIASAQPFDVAEAPEWSALFSRDRGWTGADGIYTIPLNGSEATLGQPAEHTLFLFSDTFVGDVDENGVRQPGTTLVNNTLALLRGRVPDPTKIHFHIAGGDEQPESVFIPGTPLSEPGNWYWLGDGIALDDQAHLFTLRMQEGDGGVFNFAVAGVTMISLPLASDQPLQDAIQVDTPLYYRPMDDRGEIILGGAMMDNRAGNGAASPDGYIYAYGTQNDPLSKKLVAARVRPESFTDFSAWRYWDGTDWTTDIDTIHPMTGRISAEFSVTPLTDGRYIMIFQLDTLSDVIAARIGQSPVGPWGEIIRLYTCPEPALDPDIYSYNAKAHPHLSAEGELLISYNVNTLDFWDHFNYADIYRPRFVRLSLTP